MLDEPAADPDAADEVQGNWLFGSNDAADLLEIRYTDREAVRAVNPATRRRCVCSRRCRQCPGKLVLAGALHDAGGVSPSRHLSWGRERLLGDGQVSAHLLAIALPLILRQLLVWSRHRG